MWPVGKGKNATLEILCTAGNTTWAPYAEAKHLAAMNVYCEAMGVAKARDLPAIRK